VSYEPIMRWAFRHEQGPRTSTFYYRHRYKARQRPKRVTVPAVPSLRQLASADNLIDTYYDMKSRAGEGPGPDGLSYCDLSPGEVAHILRELSAAVLAGSYRPGPTRQVRIPKPRGGHRTLSVGNLCDRVVAAALHNATEPLWESVFLPCSHGFRPGRGVWTLLAELGAAISREGLWVLGLADVKDAFPSVVLADVLADHGGHILEPSLLTLTEVVLRGGDDPQRPRGIDQGSPYSPTALNVRLHHALDLGANQGHHPHRHYFRYADDLTFLRRSVSEGRQALSHASRLLEMNGFAIKAGADVHDLRAGQKAQLLGLLLSMRDGRLHLQPGRDAWKKLEQALVMTHETANPTGAARTVVNGWVEAYGLAFADWRVTTLDRLLMMAARLGFREVTSPEGLADQCELAWRRWDTFRRRVAGKPPGEAVTTTGAG
jgi:hypothetical protein